MKIGGAEAIGPILMGMSKPVYVLPRGAEVEDIVNITALGVVEAQSNGRAKGMPTTSTKTATAAQ
jgi:malate dehydrogenase (oxaloacetate-decarboxylating)(NADP+)